MTATLKAVKSYTLTRTTCPHNTTHSHPPQISFPGLSHSVTAPYFVCCDHNAVGALQGGWDIAALSKQPEMLFPYNLVLLWLVVQGGAPCTVPALCPRFAKSRLLWTRNSTPQYRHLHATIPDPTHNGTAPHFTTNYTPPPPKKTHTSPCPALTQPTHPQITLKPLVQSTCNIAMQHCVDCVRWSGIRCCWLTSMQLPHDVRPGKSLDV